MPQSKNPNIQAMNRKPYSTDLTDEQWNQIRPLLPSSKRLSGRPRRDDREIINGINYVLSTGCKWKDLPHDIEAPPSTCHDRYQELKKKGLWVKITSILND